MVNTLYLPELREMLAEQNEGELREFCTALHPARTAEFMEGLSADEAWQVLSHADEETRTEIFGYFPHERQVEIIEAEPREQVARLIEELPPDDRVDLLDDVDDEIVDELLPLVDVDDRRDIMRLAAYPEDSAGSVMTTDFAALSESLSVREAIEELSRQMRELETVYYLYIVDDAGRLRGLVSFRQMVSSIVAKPDRKIGELMETDLVSVNVLADQEQVANLVARYDLLAIPVVDDDYRLIGIITHDDVIDVVREEATEDAHRAAAVEPLEESYLRTSLLTLSWKRGVWLMVLFVAALLTAFALRHYESWIAKANFLVLYIPLVISSGGNSGSQSATLIITALTVGDVRLRDWWRIVCRELVMGLLLGGGLGLLGFIAALCLQEQFSLAQALIIPITLLLVVVSGTLTGSVLPLLFKTHRLGPGADEQPVRGRHYRYSRHRDLYERGDGAAAGVAVAAGG